MRRTQITTNSRGSPRVHPVGKNAESYACQRERVRSQQDFMTDAPAPFATVAVVIRTKDRPLFLARALESVLAQTYEDWVAVVVNDVGERSVVDFAVEAVADRAGGRFHVVHNSVSRGREAAMNTGLHATSSTFIVIHDDDDTWAPTFLQETVGYLLENEAHGVATRTEVVFEHLDGNTIVTDRTELLAADKHAISLLDIVGRNYLPTNSFVYRRETQESLGDYDESMPVLADWEFNIRFLLAHDVGFIGGEPLAFWHRRPTATGSIGNSVHAHRSDHELWDTRLRDRFLRADLDRNGGLGLLLYLSEQFDRDRQVATARGGHLAGLVEELDRQVTDLSRRVEQRDAEILHQLGELNTNIVSQSNRLVAQFERLAHRFEEVYRALRDNSTGERLKRAGRSATGPLRRAINKS